MASERQIIADSIVSKQIISFTDDEENIINAGNYAFYYCSKLTSVSLPAATSIGDSTFSACSALTELVVGTDNGKTVCTYSTSSSSSDPSNANLKIYVPDSLVDDYKAATNWSRLASKIYGISERPE